jgi:aspartate racemase
MTGRHGLEVMISGERDRELIHQVIYNELVVGEIRPTSKEQYIGIMDGLIEDGAEGIILACTEIGLLVGQGDVQVPVFDTTHIHATIAVEYALGDS